MTGLPLSLLRSEQILRTTITIFLFTIIFLQTFAPFVYDAAYSFNKKYIAETFCVNKNKPAMHCNGHCYLEKQKQKQENSDKQSNDTKREKFEVTAYCLPQINTLNNKTATAMAVYPANAACILQGYSSSVFHPPLA